MTRKSASWPDRLNRLGELEVCILKAAKKAGLGSQTPKRGFNGGAWEWIWTNYNADPLMSEVRVQVRTIPITPRSNGPELERLEIDVSAHAYSIDERELGWNSSTGRINIDPKDAIDAPVCAWLTNSLSQAGKEAQEAASSLESLKAQHERAAALLTDP